MHPVENIARSGRQPQLKREAAIRWRYPYPRRGAYDDVTLEMPVAESTFKERRNQQRIPFEAPSTISADQHTLAASIKDISIRGLFLFHRYAF